MDRDELQRLDHDEVVRARDAALECLAVCVETWTSLTPAQRTAVRAQSEVLYNVLGSCATAYRQAMP